MSCNVRHGNVVCCDVKVTQGSLSSIQSNGVMLINFEGIVNTVNMQISMTC